MTNRQRTTVFLATLLFLGITYYLFNSPTLLTGPHAVVIFSALVMLSFTALLAEHFFTRPTDVVASTTSVLLLISPIRPLLAGMGNWYWALWGYSATFFGISLSALLLLDKTKSQTSTRNRVSEFLYKTAITFGNGRIIWFSVFVIATLFYVNNQSALFVILLAYSAFLLLLDPSKALNVLRRRESNNDTAVAEIFSVQSDTAFLSRALPDAPNVHRFDVVGFSLKAIEEGKWKTGLVLNTYQLNNERWLRILISDTFAELDERTNPPHSIRDSTVYLLKAQDGINLLQILIGTVSEKSDIETVNFEYAFRVPIEEGELVEVECRGRSVLYQVVEGFTETERLEARDEAGKIIGEAAQLGIWNSGTRRFDRFGWVPVMNSPVLKARPIEAPEPNVNEYCIGSIPGTNFPVFIDLDSAVTHHLAILGVTGSGKSVFARNLIRQISGHGTKVICVDFTNEYSAKLSDMLGGALIDETKSSEMFGAIDKIESEMEKFPNQRDKKIIENCENALQSGFGDAIKQFAADSRKAVLFELPDVANSTGILEYTKWFFKSVFRLAREKSLSDKKICIVLEEAHTVIPEWNFLGVEDRRSGAVVNTISQIALQGRKYGVGFVVIAQRTANVSKTVLTQCNSIVAFQQFDKTSAEFLANHVGRDYLAALTRLKARHAIAVGKAFSSGTPMIFQVPELTERDMV